MKKLKQCWVIILLVGIITGLILMYISPFYKYQKLKIIQLCTDEVVVPYINSCNNIWGKPGDECRKDFFDNTYCGKLFSNTFDHGYSTN